MTDLHNDILNVFNGQTPIKRQNRLEGQTEYYFINPGQGNVPFSELKTTDIPDGQPLFNTGQGLNQNQQVRTDNNLLTGIPIFSNLYNAGQKIGEFVADVQIAKNYKDQMDATGQQLVQTFGKGQGADIDNYYHPLLQCELSHISPQSQKNGIALGYAKEGWDYVKKKFNGMEHQTIINDSKKDLQNNLYGSNLGANNPNRSCLDLLDDMRTPNMRKLNIR